MSALDFALRGDDALFAAIAAADPGTFGISCMHCDTYHIGRIDDGHHNNRCPGCLRMARGSFESPALGSGLRTIQQTWDDGGGAVIAALVFTSRTASKGSAE